MDSRFCGSLLKDAPSDYVHLDVKPQIAGDGCWSDDDATHIGVGFNPEFIAEICHDVSPTNGYSEVAGKNLGMVQRVDAGGVEKTNSQMVVLITQRARRAVMPPKRECAANKPGVDSAEAAQKQRINEATSDKARAINAFVPLATPNVGYAVVAPQSGDVITAKRRGVRETPCRQGQEASAKNCDTQEYETERTALPSEGDEPEPGDEQ